MNLLTLCEPVTQGTIVTYPGGSLFETSKIIGYTRVTQANGHRSIAFFTKETPFHPLNDVWPDQPSDKGQARLNKLNLTIPECFVVAINKQEHTRFLIRPQLKRQEREDWHFLIAHTISDQEIIIDPDLLLRQEVELQVDEHYRYALDRLHSACHLAALALNKITTLFWKKAVTDTDSLGNPNFDKAIDKSVIFADKAEDHYRLGNSIKRQGFDAVRLLQELPAVEQAVNEQLQKWVQGTDYPITITPPRSSLMALRLWECPLPDGLASIPCGGTHVKSTKDLQGLQVTMQQTSDHEFCVTTHFTKN